MLISELQEKLEKVKQEFGDVEVYMECWNTVDARHVCVVLDEYDDSFVVYITDNVEGLEEIFENVDFKLICEF